MLQFHQTVTKRFKTKERTFTYNNNEKERNFEISLDFLHSGKTYQMTSFEDGINAGRQAMDYRKKETTVKNGEKINIKMVRNGGFAAVIQ